MAATKAPPNTTKKDNPPMTRKIVPVTLTGNAIITSNSTGNLTGKKFALTESGYAWAWGYGSVGFLGNNAVDNQPLPVSVVGGKRFTQIASSLYAAAGIDTSGYIWTWGGGSNGILGNNSTANRSSPVSVVGGRTFTQVAGYDYNFLALDSSGYAWAWGFNTYGSVGDGTSAHRSSPVSVLGGRIFTKIAVGYAQCFAIDNSGYMWAWGRNGAGTLGDGTLTTRSSPVSVLGGRTFINVLPSTWNPSVHTLALDTSSFAWAWGTNASGQLGNGSTAHSSSPVSVLGGRQFSALHPHGTQGCVGLDSSGYAWAWGLGSVIMGNGSTANRSSPVSVLGGNRFTQLAVLGQAIVGIDTSSYAWAWGKGYYGVTGQDRADRSSPVSIFAAYATGDYAANERPQFSSIHTLADDTVCGITAAGKIYAWGYNNEYQAGSGDGLTYSAGTSADSRTISDAPQFTALINDKYPVATKPEYGAGGGVIAGYYKSYLNAPGDFTVTFKTADGTAASAPVTGFTAGDIQTTNCTVSNFAGSGAVYTFTVTPTSGVSSFTVPDDCCVDAEGDLNGGMGISQTIYYDTTRPTTVLSSPSVADGDIAYLTTIPMRLTVSGLGPASDITNQLSNPLNFTYVNCTGPSDPTTSGINSFSGSDQYYDFTVERVADGPVSIKLEESSIAGPGTATDGYGNYYQASNTFSFCIDTIPSVVLTANPAATGRKVSFTATFSEDVTGVTIDDVVVTNGTASNFAGSGSVYTFDVLPSNSVCTVSAYIVAGAGSAVGFLNNMNALEGEGALSTVSNTLTFTHRPLGDNRDVIVGAKVGAFLDASGYAWAWGVNSTGSVQSIGDNTGVARSSPVSVVGGIRFKKLVSVTNSNSGAYWTSFAGLDLMGRAWCWGDNGFGQLGDGTVTHRSSPVSVIGGKVFTDIITGSGDNDQRRTAVFAVDPDGYWFSWGANNDGTLGDGTTQNKSSPVSVLGGRKFTKITAHAANVVALDQSGYAWAWGHGMYGSNGNSSNADRSSPVSVVGGRVFSDVVSGYYYTVGLDTSGYAWSWGFNPLGCLGDGTATNRSSPVSVLGGRVFSALPKTMGNVQAQNPQTYLLDASSYAWAWGSNGSGALGDGTATNRSSPVSVLGGRQFSVISNINTNAGIALDSSGFAWTWGPNGNGGLGDGTTTTRSSPVSVVGGKTFLKLPAPTVCTTGSSISMLDKSGTLWSWGFNTSGAGNPLGDGTTTSRSSPVSVLGGRYFKAPTLSLSSSVANNSQTALNTVPMTATWSDSVTGFTSGDVDVAKGSVSNFSGAGTAYTFDVDRTAGVDGAATVFVGDTAAVSSLGNFANQDAASYAFTFSDITSPTVTLTSSTVASGATTATSPISMTATFSESVTGFVVGDLSLTNCTAGSFSGSGTTYTFNLTPSGQGAVSVTVPESVAADAAGNNNTASSAYSFTYATTAVLLPGNFLAASSVISGQPLAITITRSTIAGLPAIAASGYFSVTANWKYIIIYYKNMVTGQKRVVVRRATADFSGNFKATAASGSVFQLRKIIIAGRNRSVISVQRAQIDNASAADITIS